MDPWAYMADIVVFGDWVYFSVVVVESRSVAGTPLISQPILSHSHDEVSWLSPLNHALEKNRMVPFIILTTITDHLFEQNFLTVLWKKVLNF